MVYNVTSAWQTLYTDSSLLSILSLLSPSYSSLPGLSIAIIVSPADLYNGSFFIGLVNSVAFRGKEQRLPIANNDNIGSVLLFVPSPSGNPKCNNRKRDYPTLGVDSAPLFHCSPIIKSPILFPFFPFFPTFSSLSQPLHPGFFLSIPFDPNSPSLVSLVNPICQFEGSIFYCLDD